MNKKQELKQQIENAEKVLNSMKKDLEKMENEVELRYWFRSFEAWKEYIHLGTKDELEGTGLHTLLCDKKLYAQLKLQHIADVLNGDIETPNYFYINAKGKVYLTSHNEWGVTDVLFRNYNDVVKAMEIMGSDMEYLK
jgi:hypothetical protein